MTGNRFKLAAFVAVVATVAAVGVFVARDADATANVVPGTFGLSCLSSDDGLYNVDGGTIVPIRCVEHNWTQKRYGTIAVQTLQVGDGGMTVNGPLTLSTAPALTVEALTVTDGGVKLGGPTSWRETLDTISLASGTGTALTSTTFGGRVLSRAFTVTDVTGAMPTIGQDAGTDTFTVYDADAGNICNCASACGTQVAGEFSIACVADAGTGCAFPSGAWLSYAVTASCTQSQPKLNSFAVEGNNQ